MSTGGQPLRTPRQATDPTSPIRADVAEIANDLESAGFAPTEAQRQMLSRYVALVEERGAVVNLVSPRDLPRVARRHLLESLNILLWPVALTGRKLVDVGSGAGFPGVPLAIMCPELCVTLVEKVERKAQFLEAVRTKLRIAERVEVWSERADMASARGDVRASFDVAVARGLGPLRRAAGWLSPFVKPGGHVLTFKGSRVDEELADSVDAVARSGLRLVDVMQLRWGHGSLVVFERCE